MRRRATLRLSLYHQRHLSMKIHSRLHRQSAFRFRFRRRTMSRPLSYPLKTPTPLPIPLLQERLQRNLTRRKGAQAGSDARFKWSVPASCGRPSRLPLRLGLPNLPRVPARVSGSPLRRVSLLLLFPFLPLLVLRLLPKARRRTRHHKGPPSTWHTTRLRHTTSRCHQRHLRCRLRVPLALPLWTTSRRSPALAPDRDRVATGKDCRSTNSGAQTMATDSRRRVFRQRTRSSASASTLAPLLGQDWQYRTHPSRRLPCSAQSSATLPRRRSTGGTRSQVDKRDCLCPRTVSEGHAQVPVDAQTVVPGLRAALCARGCRRKRHRRSLADGRVPVWSEQRRRAHLQGYCPRCRRRSPLLGRAYAHRPTGGYL